MVVFAILRLEDQAANQKHLVTSRHFVWRSMPSWSLLLKAHHGFRALHLRAQLLMQVLEMETLFPTIHVDIAQKGKSSSKTLSASIGRVFSSNLAQLNPQEKPPRRPSRSFQNPSSMPRAAPPRFIISVAETMLDSDAFPCTLAPRRLCCSRRTGQVPRVCLLVEISTNWTFFGFGLFGFGTFLGFGPF